MYRVPGSALLMFQRLYVLKELNPKVSVYPTSCLVVDY